jgi:hypothetical protein
MPTTRRHWRRIEDSQGIGTISGSEAYHATVTYQLTVLQEVIGTRHWSGSSAVQGERRVRGRVQITTGASPAAGDPLTLLLDDGRSIAFHAVGNGPEYSIDPTGPLA